MRVPPLNKLYHDISNQLTYLLIFLIGLYMTINTNKPEVFNDNNCSSILTQGRYIDNATTSPYQWQPLNCVHHNYTREDFQKCFKEGDEVVIIGDSTARRIFWALLSILDTSYLRDNGYQGNNVMERAGIKFRFFWDIMMNDKENLPMFRKFIESKEKPENGRRPIFAYATTGLWFAYNLKEEKVIPEFQHNVDAFFDILKNRSEWAPEHVFFGPTQIPYYPKLEEKRYRPLSKGGPEKMVQYFDKLFGYFRGKKTPNVIKAPNGEIAAEYVPVYNDLGGTGHQDIYDEIGVHYSTFQTTNIQANILLNYLCNEKLFSKQKTHQVTCCTKYDKPSIINAFVLPSLMTLGIIARVALPLNDFKPMNINVKGIISFVTILSFVVQAASYADRSHLVNKIAIFFDPHILACLLQLWISVTFISYRLQKTSAPSRKKYGIIDYDPHNSSPLSSNFFYEFKGVAASLILVLEFAGVHNAFYNGKILIQILTAFWLFSYVYSFTQLCISSQMTFIRFLYEMLHIVLLPSLLSWTMQTSFEFYNVANHLVYWLPFIYLAFCIFKTEAFFSSAYKYEIEGLKTVPLILIWFLIIKFGSHFDLHDMVTQAELYSEFWIMAAGVLAAWASGLDFFKTLVLSLAKSNDKSSAAPRSRATILLIVSLFGCYVVNWTFFSQTFLSDDEYTSAWHVVITLFFITWYIMLRLAVLGTVPVLNFWVNFGALSFEIFILKPHLFFGNDGTGKLYLLDTGTSIDTILTTRSRGFFNFLLVSSIFGYLTWTVSKQYVRCGSTSWSNLSSNHSPSSSFSYTVPSSVESSDISEEIERISDDIDLEEIKVEKNQQENSENELLTTKNN